MGLISDYLEYRRRKKYSKRLLIWECQIMKLGLPPIPQTSTPYRKETTMTPNEAADLLRATTPAPWDIVGQVDSIGPICADSGLVVDQWDAELAAAAPELARGLVELGEVNARLKDALSSMLEILNETGRDLAVFAEEFDEYRLDDFGIQEGDMD